MMKLKLRILIIEDSENDTLLVLNQMEEGNYDIEYKRVETAEGMRAALKEKPWDIILSDYQMPLFNGLEALTVLKESGMDIPLIVVSGAIGEEVAVETMRNGARDYIMKNNLQRLLPAVERELRESKSRREQKRLQMLQKKAEARLHLQGMALEAAANCLVITDKEGVILWTNHAFTDLTGYTVEEAIGKNPRILKSGENGPGFYEHMWQTILSGKIWHGETLNRRKNGTLYTEEMTITPVNNQKEEISHFIAVKQDITERKKAEEKIRKAHHQLKRALKFTEVLFSAVPIPLFFKDREGRYIEVNEPFCEILGFTPEYYKGKTVLELWPDEFAQVYHKKDLELISYPEKQIYESRVQDKNGVVRPVIWSKNVFFDEHGQAAGIIGAFQDISERVRAEEALSASRNWLDKIINTIGDPIFVKDREHRWILLNEAFFKFMGYNRNELIGKSDYDFFPPNEADVFWEKDEIVLTTGKENINEEEITDAGGVVHTIITKKALYTDEKGDKQIVGVIRDITEQKSLEEKILQLQKMEAIGTLAGGIAHDFNNILSGIFGFSELAKDHLQDPDRAKKDIEQIIKGAQKAADLVQQILTFSRKSTHKKQPISIFHIVKESLKLLRSIIPVTIQIKENISSRATVMADPSKIHQVIMNLCINAYHAMPETGGILSIGLKEITFSQEDCIPGGVTDPGRFLRLEVSDTGHGIEAPLLQKIFEPYFTTKEPEKGTGLGLAVVLGIVQEYKGHIHVYSEPNQGTTFHVYLPIIDKTADPSVQAKTEQPMVGSESILLIDDETDLLGAVKELLEDLGYTVTAFENSVNALEAYDGSPNDFDIVVTDMTMPEMTGLELANRVLQIRPDQPIVLCTGHSELINKEKALTMGISAYYEKPVIIRDLVKVIRSVIDEPKSKH
jgi:PAS domain S-box-containing protein